MRQEVSFETDDRTTLRGLMFSPDAPTSSPKIVVMAHGFSGVVGQIEHYAAYFAQHGLTALVFDHRGFGSSEGRLRGEVDPHQQLADWRDAITFAVTAGGKPSVTEVGIWGSSFAGGLALVLAATDPRVRCAVAQIPHVSGKRNAALIYSAEQRAMLDGLIAADRNRRQAGKQPARIPVITSDPQELCALPPAFPAELVAFAHAQAPAWENSVTLRSVEHFIQFEAAGWAPLIGSVPTMMIVGAEDRCTFPQLQREVYESITAEKQLVEHPGGHFDSYAEHFGVTASSSRDWLLKHLL